MSIPRVAAYKRRRRPGTSKTEASSRLGPDLHQRLTDPGVKFYDREVARENGQVFNFRKTWENFYLGAGAGAPYCQTGDEPIAAGGPYAYCGRQWRRGDLKYKRLSVRDFMRSAVRGLMWAGVAQKPP
jgi:hypothetical protein